MLARQPSIPYLNIQTHGPFSYMSTLALSTSATFPLANKVFYYPVIVPYRMTIDRMTVACGATANGTFDIGVYSNGGNLPEQKLVSSGTTTQTATSASQLVDVTNTVLDAGLYWLALTHSNTSGTFQRSAPTLLLAKATGAVQETTGGFGLPQTATPTALADTYYALLGMHGMVIL